MPVSATLAINELSDKLKREGRKVYKLGLGQSPFPVPRAVVEELQANAYQKDYLPVRGLQSLREAVANYHSKRNDIQCNADSVLIGPGSKELMFLLQFVYYGDLVIPTPTWVSYSPQAKAIGRRIEWIETKESNKWLLLPDELHKICKHDPNRPRIVILNYPSNPTGVTYSVDELKELAKVARKYHVILLSDEIYGELQFDGKHISISRFYPEGTILSSGLSKWCGAGGWRLGTFTFPKSLMWLMDAMAAVASETFTSTSAPIQYAAVRAFEGTIGMERYLWNSRKILRRLGYTVHSMLASKKILAPQPDGAFYLFCNFENVKDKLASKNILDSMDLSTRLLEETGVALLPGTAFGRPAKELTTRLSYVDFDGVRALAAAETTPLDQELPGDFVNLYCECVIEAVQLICNWVDQKSR
jgi:aspartate aminotransferase